MQTVLLDKQCLVIPSGMDWLDFGRYWYACGLEPPRYPVPATTALNEQLLDPEMRLLLARLSAVYNVLEACP